LTYENNRPISIPEEERLFGALPVLSADEVERIREEALRALSDVGVRFDDPRARETLAAAGAGVAGEIVRFPAGMVDDACARQPERVVLGAKDPARSIPLRAKRFVTTNGFGTSRVLEPGGSVRPSDVDDLVFLTRLADGLEEVGYCQHQTTPQDVPPELLDIVQAVIVLGNTRKHCHLSNYSARFADEVLTLGEIAGDGAADPVFSVGCCSLSPLRYPIEATVLMRRAAAKGVPFLVVSGAVTGVTAPVTLAGALVVQTAEHLAALVLAQAIRAGTPVAFGSFTSPMDPRSGRQRLGAGELSLLNAGTAQLCRRFDVPFGYGTGGVSDAPGIGVQAGVEKAVTTLCAALAGVEVIHDGVSGILRSGLVVSSEQMVIDHELCRIVRRIVRGMEVSDDTLARAAIAAVGPGGNYLTSMHTAAHFRQEILRSDLWDGRAESRDAEIARAGAMASNVVEGFGDPCLTAEQIAGMVEIWCNAGLDPSSAHRVLGDGR